MSLAIFDLDETLLAGDSCSLFCQFLLDEGRAPPDFVQQDAQMMLRYQAQTLVLDDYIHFLMAPLQGCSVADINALMPRFVARYILPKIYPQALNLINGYQQKGVRMLIISATCEFIVKAVGMAIGIPDVLAIQLTVKDNAYTGEVHGVPTFREGKVTRLNNWLAQQQESIEGATFYSDSINDLALLEVIAHPVATNPDLHLQRIAHARAWPVLQWQLPEDEGALITLARSLIEQYLIDEQSVIKQSETGLSEIGQEPHHASPFHRQCGAILTRK